MIQPFHSGQKNLSIYFSYYFFMLTPDITCQIFSKLKEDPQNLKCFDCRKPNPDSCLINNGIFLCSACAGKHLSALPELTLIKQTSIDHWTNKEIKRMIVGGNAAFREFLNFYDIKPTTPISIAFRTRAAAFYRGMLLTFAEKLPFKGTFPPRDTGKLVFEEEAKGVYPELAPRSMSAPVITEQIKAYNQEQKAKTSQNEGGRLSNVYGKITNAGNQAFAKVEQFGQTPKMKEIEAKMLKIVDKVGKNVTNFVDVITGRPKSLDLTKVMYLEIANSPLHTYDKINVDQKSQQVKVEAMTALNRFTTDEEEEKQMAEFPEPGIQTKGL
ncbi:unnamed protein product [Blepharisma stoltei]|uniref:Arf-GAP domain-containing protein n=1 Tax=Blepharisma stoltei TaxID=1481888 RepID=A0AAU9IRA5_9CILI|nr:unnamed protein product [Blepharisma stoltei]